MILRLAVLLALPCAAFAQEDRFIRSNASGIFFHELGHALIDILRIPVLGQEEDAADVLSTILIDQVFDPEMSKAIITDLAHSFLATLEAEGEAPAWGVHGLNEQRYYNLVCLYFGGDPNGRADLAAELDLPPERAARCAQERLLAQDSWDTYLDSVDNARGAGSWVSLTVQGDPQTYAQAVWQAQVTEEVDALNQWLDLRVSLDVAIAFCDDPNAFYDPNQRQIIMCYEFADYLETQWQAD